MTTKQVSIRLSLEGYQALERQLKSLGPEGARAFQQIKASAEPANASLRVLDITMGQLRRQMVGLAASAGAAVSVRGVLQAVDAYRSLDNSLRILTESDKERAQLQGVLADLAAETRNTIDGTVTLYFRMQQGLGSQIRDQQRILDLVRTIQQTTATSRATPQERAGALIQFSQALATNFEAAGQEIRSLQEQLPSLVRAIEDGMGIARGSFVSMARAGRVSTMDVVEALETVSGEIGGRFAQTQRQLREGWAAFSDATMLAVGWMDDASGSSATLAAGLANLASVIRDSEALFRLLGQGVGTGTEGFANAVGLPAAAQGFMTLRDWAVALNAELEITDERLAAILQATNDYSILPAGNGDYNAAGMYRSGNMFSGRAPAPEETQANLEVIAQLQARIAAAGDPFSAWLSRLSDDALPTTRDQLRDLYDELERTTEARRQAQVLDREAARLREDLMTAEQRYAEAVAHSAELVGHAGFTEQDRTTYLRNLSVELGLAKDAQVELNAAKERALELDEQTVALRRRLMTDQDRINEQVDVYRELLNTKRITQDEFNAAVAETEERFNGARLSAEKFGEAFAQQMWEAVRSADSLGEALLGVIQKLGEMLLYQQVFQPLGQSIGSSIGSFIGLPGGGATTATAGGPWWSAGIPSRRGNLFMDGDAVPFRSGGVLTMPTSFMMPSGRRGKAAEERAEAIMPLARLDGGVLGVRAQMPAPANMGVVINNYTQQPARQERRRGPNGEELLEVTVGQMVGQGRFDKSMKGRYAVNPQPAAR